MSQLSSPDGWRKEKRRGYLKPCLRLRRDQKARQEEEGVTQSLRNQIDLSLPPTPPPLYTHLGTGSPWIRESGRKRKPGEAFSARTPALCPWLGFFWTRVPDSPGSHACLSLTPFFLLFTEVVPFILHLACKFPSSQFL